MILIESFSSFSHMNVLLYDVYWVPKTPIFSSLQFNYIKGINLNRNLYSKSKMEDTQSFYI